MSSIVHISRDGFGGIQMIGNFLSFASRGDRVGLNEMLRQGMSPNVQNYDSRTALHLAACEGHASIVELLLAYNADVNLCDRWLRTPLADAKLYQHQDICRILELNGGRDMEDHEMVEETTSALITNINPASPGYIICNRLNLLDLPHNFMLHVRHEDDPPENIDISELKLQDSPIIIKQTSKSNWKIDTPEHLEWQRGEAQGMLGESSSSGVHRRARAGASEDAYGERFGAMEARMQAMEEKANERHAIYEHELHTIRTDNALIWDNQVKMMESQAKMMEMMNKFPQSYVASTPSTAMSCEL